jgi:predicted ATPase
MRAYAQTGQRQAALRQFQALEQALRRDLDVSPSPESLLLREQILSGALAPAELLVGMALLSSPQPSCPGQQLHRPGRGACRRAAPGPLSPPGDPHRSRGSGQNPPGFKNCRGSAGRVSAGRVLGGAGPLSQPEFVARTVLNVLRLRPNPDRSETERLIEYLQDRHLLLLLDNCEHLLSSCTSLVDTLLKSCPHLHILVTSRIRLNLPGEISYLVPSLAAPDSALNRSLLELSEYDAVRLYTERLSSLCHGFTLTADNAGAVVQICQRLDGIPLALELAAARCRLMSPEQVAAQLTDMFHLLVGGSPAALPRHRTLHASIEWSYSLLSDKERLILQRLSIFSGGWSLEGARAVCAGEEIHPTEVLDLLADLVDHSLVITDISSGEEARFRLLETVRQFAQILLQENGQVLLLRQRHLTYMLKLSQQADEGVRGSQQILWIKRLEQERGNLNDALEWSLNTSSHYEMGVNLACALSWYWGRSGDFIHLADIFGKALSKSAGLGRTAARHACSHGAGWASMWRQQRFLSTQRRWNVLKKAWKYG